MEKKGKLTSKKLIIILASFFVVCGVVLGILLAVRNYVKEVSTKEKYEYYNPDETKADTDEGFKIDGVLDEDIYQNNTWLYARNENGDSYVDLAMTSYYGEKGMYFAYDVTESTNIYVNSDRSNYCNSGIEMYMAPSNASNLRYNNTYEMNLLPTGELGVYRSGGTGGFVRGETQEQNMPYLGATTKGGEVNSPDCHGYYLELFIPWEYFESQGSDMEEIKNNYMFINPAHITSYNESGTDLNADRLWYSFATQLGGDGWSDVTKYFKFDEQGLVGTVPITFEEGEHYTITGSKTVLPGMKAYVTITPEEGYALNSVRVNGEERIKKVSYKEDGSVTLVLKSKGEAITVGASAEKITEGNKTLRGVVYPHKVDGGSLKDIEISYRGPQGEKPITLDANGAFELPDLKQGYYTITVSKTGYQTLNHGISLKRDIDAELYLEYDMFVKESGTCWDIEEQNAGILTSIGGNGIVLSKDSYDKFSVEGNFRYNESIKEVTDHDYYEQQRIGIRIKFSNGKYWHIDVLQQEGEYLVQYAELTGKDSIYSWTKIHTMTTAEAAKYKSASGINLKVVRDGQYANVYLDNKFVAAEDFGDEYKDLKAQIGFESYAATDGIETLKFAIQTNKINVVKAPYFSRGGGWNITNQFQGVITLPKGGHNERLKFSQKYTDMDLTITVRDYAEGKDDSKDSPRTDVKFIFDNDKCVTFSVLQRSADGDVIIQSMGDKNALTGWPTHYKFTDAEKAQFHSATGVKFRIVRIGTEFALYINDTMVKSCDFEGKIEATTKADIYIRHWGDEGADVEVPFSMTAKLNKVTIQDTGSKNGKVTGDRKTYQIGDKVVLSGKGNDGYYCTGIKVDGKEVTLGKGGTYTFTAEKSSYKVEGTFTKSLFKDGGVWDISKQHEGKISLYGGGYQSIDFVDKYDTMDLTLTVKDSSITAVGKTRRVGVLFEFDNGKKVCFSILNNNWGKGGNQDYKEYIIQTVGQGTDDLISNGNTRLYRMKADQIEAFTSEEGLDLRIVKDGAKFYLYLGGTMINCEKNLDFTEAISGSTSAKVTISHWQGVGCDMTIPFSVSKNIPEIKPVKNIFANETAWDLSKQNEGIVSLPGGGDDYQQGIKFSDKYVDMDLKLNLKEQSSKANYHRTTVVFKFANGKTVNFSFLHNTWGDPVHNEYRVQSQATSVITNPILGQEALYDFSNDITKVNKYNGEGLDFRIVKDGAKFYLYVDNEMVTLSYTDPITKTKVNSNCMDLSQVITENTEAEVSILHWTGADTKASGNANGDMIVPFSVSDKIQPITLTGLTSDNGKVKTGQSVYFVGDTVKLTVEPETGYRCTELKVNGKVITAEEDGSYTFVATEDTYEIKATYDIDPNYKKKIFADNTVWDLSKQHAGIITLPGGGHDYEKGLKFNDKYTTMDLKLTLKEQSSKADYHRTTVVYKFANGKTMNFSFIRNTWGGPETKEYLIQAQPANGGMITNPILPDQTALYNFITDTTKVNKYNGKGLDFRIIKDGAKFYLYVDNELVTLTYKDPSTGETIQDTCMDFSKVITGSTEAEVYILHWKGADTEASGNANGDLTIPFSVSTDVSKIKIFTDNSLWDLSKQHAGIITLPGGGHDYEKGLKFNDKYTTMDLQLTLKEQSSKANYHRTSVLFKFENGKTMNFSFIRNTWGGPETKEYLIQAQPANDGMITNPILPDQTALYNFITDTTKVNKYNGEGLDFRIIKDGAKFYLYVDNELVTLKYKDPSTGETIQDTCMDFSKVITGSTEAEVYILHWKGADTGESGNTNGDLTIPFSVSKEINQEKVSNTSTDLSNLRVKNKYAFIYFMENFFKGDLKKI